MYFTCKRNIEARSRDHFCCGKSISISYSWCVSVGLAIKNARRMRLILLSSVTRLTVPYLSALSHKREIEHKMRVF